MSSLVRRAHKHFRGAIWKKGDGPASRPRQTKVAGGCKYKDPTAANSGCQGLQIQISLLSRVMHFGMEPGYMKPRFISRLPCSPFSIPKDYLLGPDLVVVVAAGKWYEETKPTSSLPPPRARERSSKVGGRQGLLPGEKRLS